jgi:hypothetical protein
MSTPAPTTTPTCNASYANDEEIQRRGSVGFLSLLPVGRSVDADSSDRGLFAEAQVVKAALDEVEEGFPQKSW